MFRPLRTSAARLLCIGALAATALASTWTRIDTGRLSGTNTVDTTDALLMSDGTKFYYKVAAAGSGSNTLTVKVQVQRINGSWDTIDTMNVATGAVLIGGVDEVPNYRSGQERVRFRLSRPIFTQAIDWKVFISFDYPY